VNPEPIFQALLGYRAAGVVRAAIELDCFSAIAEGAPTAAAVARIRGGTERSVRILLDAVAVAAPRLLAKRGKGYALTPVSRRFLVRSSPAYIGQLMPLYGHRRMWEGFYDLPAAVRAGRSVMEKDAHSADQEFWEDFARATARDAARKADRMVRLLGKKPAPSRILDLACGSGMYGATAARRIPGSTLTLFDQPNVLAQTRKLVDVPATYLEGDLFRTEFGGPYDLVLASHVFHHFSPGDCRTLMAKIHGALAPGGRLVIQEFVPDEKRSKNEQAILFAVTMLVWTKEGDAYVRSDLEKWLNETGFRKVTYHPQPEPGDVLIATR
jgi:cyclopropane fatty-acyl-phospholipid synthase-like methyltransferase